ncbi:MAG: cytochrome o ubiquinol oxidase subunit I [Candidatus Saccharimonadales bacterium]
MLGRLTLSDFNHGLVVLGGQLTIVFSVLAVIAFLTYTKRWKWLWDNWLTSLDPKKIGVMYILVALLMLLRGGADAAMMRAQQAVSVGSNHGFLSADHFQQIFSAHGTIMIFFVAMGLMFGIINLVVPLQIGARDVAFPFLNSISFWLFVAGMMLINTSLLVGEFSTAGWLAYPPLSELQFSPGVGVDYWIWALQIAGVGSLLSGLNFLVTILRMRAPGMTLMKMPIFCWSVLCSMSLILWAFPILTATLALLALDRTLGMHFFTAGQGGNAMMYVNLIWAWGHPEVYILILPAFGIFSEVVATFSRKRLFGYTSMVLALAAITILSFLVWLHHFFTMGAGADVNTFFGIMTMVIAIPTGVKVFNWLFTMFRGRIWFTTPMMWFLGFVATFTIGGMTGVMLSVPPADFQLHNSLFLVAHFHNMIIGGVVFGYFAGLIYWFPKIFGFRLNELLGKYAVWFWVIGFMLAFLPLYALGLMGATRRMDHYDASLGWQWLFIIAAIGVAVIFIGIGFIALQVIYSIWKRRDTIDMTGDPWGGRTLEWSTPSPVPFYNFAATPVVTERDAWWAMKHNKSHPKPRFEDIHLPKNSGLGLIIASFAFISGFALIWHIWWLAPIGLVGIIGCVIARAAGIEEKEYKVTAAELEAMDRKLRKFYA